MVDAEFIRDRLLKEVLNDSYPDELRSVLLYQAGQIIELTGGENAEALRQYLLALKLEDPYPLPVLATCSILARARSYERLNKFTAMAEERTEGRVLDLVKLLLAEHLDAAPVEDRDRLQLLHQVADGTQDRVLALALLEWEALCQGDRTEHVRILEGWIDATRDARVACQLRLELARIESEKEDHGASLDLLAKAMEGNGGIFPVLPETVRLGLLAGEHVKTATLLLQEAETILAHAEGQDESLGARFILASPRTGEQAACHLLLMAWQLLSSTPESRREDEPSGRIQRVLDGIAPRAVLECGLDGIAVDHMLATGRQDQLKAYLETVGQDAGGIEAAWNSWNLARVSLAGGDLEDVSHRLAAIRELGLDSRVLDALESLGGGASGGEPGSEAEQDPVQFIMAQVASWTATQEHEELARALAGLESLETDIADLAYAAARLAGDSFLRTRALQAWGRASETRAVAALLDGIRSHGFERLSGEKLTEVLENVEAMPPAAMVYAQLVSLARLGVLERTESFRRDLEPLVQLMLGADVTEPRSRSIVDFVMGDDPGHGALADQPHPMGRHHVLGVASRAERGDDLDGWLASVIDEPERWDPELVAVVAHLRLGNGPLPEDLVDKLARLLDPASGLDPGMRLLLSMQLGAIDGVMASIAELIDALEPGRVRCGLHLLRGIGQLAAGGDPEAAMEAVTSALEDDPTCIEALFAFAFLAPATGRWADLSVALERLVEAGDSDDPHVIAWRRQRMIASMVIDGDLQAAVTEAEAILHARGGDPLALIVKMAAAGTERDLQGFMSELARLTLWYGDPSLKGQLVHHQLQFLSLVSSVDVEQDQLPRPDVANLSHWVANAALNGPVDLTDSGIDAALAEFRALRSVPFRVAALSQLAELVEAAGQPSRALEIFSTAFDDDPLDPSVIEGMMRLGRDLEVPAALAAGCEARAGLTPDSKRAVKLLLTAAEEYSRDEATVGKAAECYQRAADLDPSDPRSFSGLVRAMELRGDLDALIELIESKVANTFDPEEIESLQLKLADLKRKTKDFQGAILALEDLLLVQPGKVTAWKMKLDLFLQMQDFGQALSTAEQLLGKLKDRSSRIAVLQKCVSVSLTKLKDLDAGLKYCLLLVNEGGAEPDLVNKTMRLALRLEKWDEAAALQQSLADLAKTPRERINMLLKKAEILIRYARDAQGAEEVYRSILEQEPVTWDALVRWNAARGADGLKLEELEPYLDRTRSILEEDPSRIDAITFLVKAYRMLRIPAAARHYDTILKLLVEPDDEAGQAPARPSLATMLPDIPSGAIPTEDRDELLNAHGPSALVAGVLANLCEGGALELLRERGKVSPAPETKAMEPSLPVARQLEAWAGALGVASLTLVTAEGLEEGARLIDGEKLAVDATVGHTAPQDVQFRMGVGLGALALRVPVAVMMEQDAVVELVKAGLLAADCDPAPIMPGEGTVELADALRGSCTAGCISRLASLAEVAPASHGEAIAQGVRNLQAGLMRAGLLVSGSFWGLLLYRHPSLQNREDCSASEIQEFLEADPILVDGLRFLLSTKFGETRRALGLEY